MIANALPWLRKVGLGVALFIPSANGKPADIPNWKGETEITPETPENVIGPMTIGGLAFDDQGDASIQGVPVSELEKALGTSLGISMDPNTIAMIKSLGADTIDIKLTPNGVALMLGDKPLPGIAYDSATLEQAVTLADAFVDEQTAETLNKVTEILPNADVETVISLTGEPAVETELAKIPVVINDDGTLSVFGLPAGADTVIDPETLTKLQDANIQHLDLNIDEDGIAVATNGQKLPTIGWNDESLQTLADIIGPMAGMSPDLIETVLGMVRNTGIQASVALPVAAGERAIDIPAQVDMTMTPSDLGDMVPPTIHAVAKFDKNGELLEFGGLSAESLAALGVSGISLPPDTMATLNDLGAQNIEIKSEPNKLILYLDGAEALTINNDTESLANALDLAAPFLGEDSPLSDPALSQLLREQILPLIPAMDLDVTVEIE
jgi:sulfur carrier protein ThiS